MKPLYPLLLLLSLVPTLASGAERVRPEEVGLSSERLKRIHELVQRHIDARSFSGVVTLVARNGRIGHF